MLLPERGGAERPQGPAQGLQRQSLVTRGQRAVGLPGKDGALPSSSAGRAAGWEEWLRGMGLNCEVLTSPEALWGRPPQD